jgi:hypothetical protein
MDRRLQRRDISICLMIWISYLVGLLAFSFSVPSHAASLNLTFQEIEFGFADLTTTSPGAQWAGTISVPTYTSSPNSSFALDRYEINLADAVGGALVFESDQPRNIVAGEPHVENDGAGAPFYLSNAVSDASSIANSFTINLELLLNGTPQTGYVRAFNTISVISSRPNGNEGTWLLASFASGGFGIVGSPQNF